VAVCERGAGGRRVGVHVGDPAEIAGLRGPKKRAKTDRADARLLRTLLLEGGYRNRGFRPHTCWSAQPWPVLLHPDGGAAAWRQRIHAQLFHQGCPPITALLSGGRPRCARFCELSATSPPVCGHRATAYRRADRRDRPAANAIG